MAKSNANRGGGWPSKTGNPSGGGRTNAPSRGSRGSASWPSKTGNPSGGGRTNAPPKR